MLFVFFFNDTATTEIYTLSLHDALPIWARRVRPGRPLRPADRHGQLAGRAAALVRPAGHGRAARAAAASQQVRAQRAGRSEEHTSELQSRQYLVCRLLLEKKKKNTQKSI